MKCCEKFSSLWFSRVSTTRKYYAENKTKEAWRNFGNSSGGVSITEPIKYRVCNGLVL